MCYRLHNNLKNLNFMCSTILHIFSVVLFFYSCIPVMCYLGMDLVDKPVVGKMVLFCALLI